MKTQKLSFTNQAKTRLAGRLDLPADDEPIAYTLFAHCFTCNKNLKAVANISRALTAARIAVLRFDFTGLGQSEGDFAETGLSSNVDDLIAAAEFLAENYAPPSILVGHSLGGTAALLAAHRIPSVKAVATIGSPADPKNVTRLLGNQKEVIVREGAAEVSIGGRPFRIKKEFVDELERTQMKDVLRKLRKALLIFHSPLDQIVSIDNAAELFQMALHPKSFVSLDKADHLLSDERDSRYVGAVIAAWARKYIQVSEPKAVHTVQEDNRVVAQNNTESYRTEIMVRGYTIVADEPVAAGGTDTGPTPYDLLVAGLGACTAMTLRMYAQRQGWPMESVVVRLEHEKIHAKDCPECDQSNPRIDRIEREIEINGALNVDQKRRLMEIADKCPVHRTLHSEVLIPTRLKE